MGINKIYITIYLVLFTIIRGYSIDKVDSLHRVLKIKTKGNYYVLYTQRNDSLFKIVSKKVPLDKKTDLEPIRKGLYYNFTFGNKEHEAKDGAEPLAGLASHLHVKHTKYVFIDDDTKIKFAKRFHCRIYTTKNLIGLYYVPSTK